MKKFCVLFRVFLIVMATSLSAAISTPYGSGIEAVIFDCDGVLVDTEYSKFLAWQEALKRKNISFSLEEYRPLVGHSSKNILKMIRQQKGIEIPEDVIEVKNTQYRMLQEKGVLPIREMVEFASVLAQKKEGFGLKLALASSAPKNEILCNLKQIGLENAFDLVLSGSDDLENYSDPEGKNKPKPYIYMEAAKRLHISPAKCLVFEDTNAGIEAAFRAGMIAIAVPNQFTDTQDFSCAKQVVRSYSDLSFEKMVNNDLVKSRSSISATVPSYPSLEMALRDKNYSTLFLDAWGVFWDGNERGAFPGSLQTMERLFAAGKKIVILSNSTQPSQNEIRKYSAQGFVQGKHFHFLITSGDLAKELFSTDKLPFPTPNKKYILLFPTHPRFAPSSTLFDTSSFRETNDLKEADFIYINIPHMNGVDQEEKEIFRPMVEQFLESKKPMVCANPDLYASEGSPSRLVVRQGTIAALYEEMGGSVFYTGKPFSAIFERAYEQINRLASTSKEEILMVGDTPETDIRGARSFGIHSALITHTGIMTERIARKGSKAIQSLPPTDIPSIFVDRLAPSNREED